jgi:hypothetical protein
MKNNTLTKINISSWDNIKYYFRCFKKNHHNDNEIIKIHLNDYEKDVNEIYLGELEKDYLLGVRPITMDNR